MTEISSLKKQL